MTNLSSKVTETIQCCGETKILNEMKDAVASQNGLSYRNTPGLMVKLADHRKHCSTCRGIPLIEQFFQTSEVSVEEE